MGNTYLLKLAVPGRTASIPQLVLNTFPEGEEPLCYLHCSRNRYLYTTFPKIWVWLIEDTKGLGSGYVPAGA